MGCESSASASVASASPSSSSPNGKRGRDPEDEVYLDNFHSQKRYLSEIMASSLNGLTVGDTLSESLMESPARSDTMCYLRDEICYSPMSEDSDDSRYCDTPSTTTMAQVDVISSPTSPVSPHRHQKPVTGLSSNNPYPLPGCTLAAVVCCHSRQRGSDSEGRFPSSPNDMCHTADLRRAALLRSVQMRAQPHCSPAYELPFNSGQESLQCDEEGEDRAYSDIKTPVDETEYQTPESEPDVLAECSPGDGLTGTKHDCERKCYGIKYDDDRRML